MAEAADGGGAPETVSKADHDKAIADLKAEHQVELGKVNQEAAGHRVARNAALRRSHALDTMLTAHQIDTSGVTDDALKGLEIEDGKVTGTFTYTAPAPGMPSGKGDGGGKPPGAGSGGLTKAKLQSMTQE